MRDFGATNNRPAQTVIYSSIFSSRWAPVVAGLPITTLILLIAATRFSKVDFLPELTVYRIGDALSLLFGEGSNVLPVQGLLGALLAKFIMWTLLTSGQTPLITVGSVAIYMIMFFGAVLAAIAFAAIVSWPILSNVQRCAILILLACPWMLGGASISLIFEPDYWVTEWAYFIISACLLAYLGRTLSPYMAATVGAWLAIGVGIKITLIGIAPLFFFAIPNRSWSTFSIVAASFVVAYCAIAFLYMGDLTDTVRLLLFQFAFFAHPNQSVQYTDLFSLLWSRPFLICLAVASGLSIVTSTVSLRERTAAIIWVLGFAYVVWRRPHDTSIASAATAFTFIAIYFVRKWSTLVVVTSFLISGAALEGFDRIKWEYATIRNGGWWLTSQEEFSDLTGMIFLPDNGWNAGLSVQALGYNGGLGLYPLRSNANGLPYYEYGGRAFQALFPNTVIILEGTSFAAAEAALKAGVPIWWTRPDPPDRPEMERRMGLVRDLVERSGASIQTRHIKVNGQDWLFQSARK